MGSWAPSQAVAVVAVAAVLASLQPLEEIRAVERRSGDRQARRIGISRGGEHRR
jgi:hypothetical protein